jgi:hypothetical protein
MGFENLPACLGLITLPKNPHGHSVLFDVLKKLVQLMVKRGPMN